MPKLYILRTLEGHNYDEYDKFVIQANSPLQARQIAHDADYDAATRWLDPKRSSCKLLKVGKKPKVVVGSFNAG